MSHLLRCLGKRPIAKLPVYLLQLVKHLACLLAYLGRFAFECFRLVVHRLVRRN